VERDAWSVNGEWWMVNGGWWIVKSSGEWRGEAWMVASDERIGKYVLSATADSGLLTVRTGWLVDQARSAGERTQSLARRVREDQVVSQTCC
jgi:hypothetical protein